MKILVLLSRVPYPTEKGDKLRAFHQIRCLSKNHEIYLVALADENIHPDAEKILSAYCREIHLIPVGKIGMIWNVFTALITGKPLQVGYFFRKRVRKKIEALTATIRPDHVYCQLIRMAEYARNLPVKKTIDYQDVLSVGMQRRKETSIWWLRPFFNQEYKRLTLYEKEIFPDFDHHTIISLPDRNLFPHPDNKLIDVIPNGVDQEYFTPRLQQRKFDILFTGNMGYPPNVDAAQFLVNEILPRVRKALPDVTVMIAGTNPSPDVLALSSPTVTVTGWVPDIRDCYAASRIFIAPMRIGTGLQNKLLEAMAMQLPCITSELAYSALNTNNSRIILVSNTVVDFSNNIIRLLRDQTFAYDMAITGRAFVLKNFNWESATSRLEAVFKK